MSATRKNPQHKEYAVFTYILQYAFAFIADAKTVIGVTGSRQ
jgi:hypothetical protein